jgi:non-specific serine/threonine protein kinase
MFDIRTEVDLENMRPFGNTEGKNSSVFLAHDKQLQQQFIVKKIKKEDIFNDFGNTNENNLFLESSILYKVSHPNITEIQYASSDKEFVYLVMPYYTNGSIQSLLESRNLTMREFIKISLEFLNGLLFVHSNNLVHFDIKPTNILINNNGKAVLTDFGLAKYLDETTELATPNKLYCTHWPPEYFISNEMGRQADIYQAGITLYRLVNGDKLWRQQVANFNKDDVKNGRFLDRKGYLPHVPVRIRKIINRCIEVSVDKRYETVLDIINDISRIDGKLDWQYQRVSVDNEVWTNSEGKMKICISLKQIGDAFTIKTLKTNLESHKASKVTKMCKNDISKEEAYKAIEEFTK